jgi:hypothetical protein
MSIYRQITQIPKTNTDALIDASLEVNADKTKYMLTSRHQNAGQNHDIENAAEFKYLETTVSNFDSRGNKERDEFG